MRTDLPSSVALTSAARTATPSATALTEAKGRGLQVIVDVTASPNNAETLIPAIQAYDPGSQKYVAYTAFTGITASTVGATATTQTYVFTLYPSAAETTATSLHEVQALPLPANYRVVFTHSSTGSWTYTASVSELP